MIKGLPSRDNIGASSSNAPTEGNNQLRPYKIPNAHYQNCFNITDEKAYKVTERGIRSYCPVCGALLRSVSL